MWTKTDESMHKLEQDEKGGGGVSMPTKMRETRDEQTKRAVSMENMDEEGRKPTLTGEEETSWRGGGKEEQ